MSENTRQLWYLRKIPALLGTTRETVSVLLPRFEREGLIARSGRQIVLRDLPRLSVRAREVSHSAERGRAPPIDARPVAPRASAPVVTGHL